MSIFGATTTTTGDSSSVYPTLSQVVNSAGDFIDDTLSPSLASNYADQSIYMADGSKVHYYDPVGESWLPLELPSEPGARTVDELQDTDLSAGVEDQQVLVYDGTRNLWVPRRAPQLLDAFMMDDGVLNLKIGSEIIPRSIQISRTINGIEVTDTFYAILRRLHLNPENILSEGVSLISNELMYAWLKADKTETIIYSEAAPGRWLLLTENADLMPMGTDVTSVIDSTYNGIYEPGLRYPYGATFSQSTVSPTGNTQTVRINLRYLGDVNFPVEPSMNDVLTYNETNHKFENKQLRIEDLQNVNLETAATDGQVLAYDIVSNEFKPVDMTFPTPSLRKVEVDSQTGMLSFRVGTSYVSEYLTDFLQNTYTRVASNYYYQDVDGKFHSGYAPNARNYYPVYQSDALGKFLIFVDDPNGFYWNMVESTIQNVSNSGLIDTGAPTSTISRGPIGGFSAGVTYPTGSGLMYHADTVENEQPGVLTKAFLDLNSLRDVQIVDTPESQSVLMFDSTLGKFVPTSGTIPEFSLFKTEWAADEKTLNFRVGTNYVPEQLLYNNVTFQPLSIHDFYYYSLTGTIESGSSTHHPNADFFIWTSPLTAAGQEVILYNDQTDKWIHFIDTRATGFEFVVGDAYMLPTPVTELVSGTNGLISATSPTEHIPESFTNERINRYLSVQFKLNRLVDVEVQNPLDGQVLMFDMVSKTFVNRDIVTNPDTSLRHVQITNGVLTLKTGHDAIPRHFTVGGSAGFLETPDFVYVYQVGSTYTVVRGEPTPTENLAYKAWCNDAGSYALLDDGTTTEWAFWSGLNFTSVPSNSATISATAVFSDAYDGDKEYPVLVGLTFVDTVISNPTSFDVSLGLEQLRDVDLGKNLSDAMTLCWDVTAKKMVPTFGFGKSTLTALDGQYLEFSASQRQFLPVTLDLERLNDVAGTAASVAGQVLRFSGTSNSYEPFTLTLDNLGDVVIDTPQSGDQLKFDSVDGVFKNVQPQLNDATDVSFDPLTISDDQILRYDSQNGVFTARDLNIDGIGGIDVSTPAVDGDILVSDGTEFKPEQLTLSNLRDTADISIASLGNFLAWDGTTWKPKELALGDASNVDLSSGVQEGQILRANADGIYEPYSLTMSLETLNMVTPPTEGQFLVFRGEEFVPETIDVENRTVKKVLFTNEGILKVFTGLNGSTLGRTLEYPGVPEGLVDAGLRFLQYDAATSTWVLRSGRSTVANISFRAWASANLSILVLDGATPAWYAVSEDVRTIGDGTAFSTAVPSLYTFDATMEYPLELEEITHVESPIVFEVEIGDLSMLNVQGASIGDGLVWDGTKFSPFPVASSAANFPTATAGQTVIYDGTEWVATDPIPSDLTNAPVDKDILQYDAATSVFVPASLVLDRLGDVEMGGEVLTDQHFMIYDTASGKWQPKVFDGTGVGIPVFDLTGVTDGDILTYSSVEQKMVPTALNVDSLFSNLDFSFPRTITHPSGVELEYAGERYLTPTGTTDTYVVKSGEAPNNNQTFSAWKSDGLSLVVRDSVPPQWMTFIGDISAVVNNSNIIAEPSLHEDFTSYPNLPAMTENGSRYLEFVSGSTFIVRGGASPESGVAYTAYASATLSLIVGYQSPGLWYQYAGDISLLANGSSITATLSLHEDFANQDYPLQMAEVTKQFEGGETLVYDAARQAFVPADPTVTSLKDVNLSSPSAGEALVLDESGKWVNIALSTLSLTDIDASVPPVDQSILKFDSANGKYVPVELDLNSLSDVTFNEEAIQDKMILRYSAAQATFQAVPFTMSNLSDVSLSGLSTGSVLAYDSVQNKWAPVSIDGGAGFHQQKMEMTDDGVLKSYIGFGIRNYIQIQTTETFDVRIVSERFEIGGVSQPNFQFTKCSTYIFNVEDPSLDSQNFLSFSSTSEPLGVTTYVDGVTHEGTPGQPGARTILVVPENAPDTLYYYNVGDSTPNTPSGGIISVVECPKLEPTAQPFRFDPVTEKVHRAASVHSNAYYPAWVNSEVPVKSFIYYDDELPPVGAPRFVEIDSDANLIEDGTSLSGTNYVLRNYWTDGELYPSVSLPEYELVYFQGSDVDGLKTVLTTEISLNKLADVNTVESAPIEGSALVYSVERARWEPGFPSNAIFTSSVTLSTVSDVNYLILPSAWAGSTLGHYVPSDREVKISRRPASVTNYYLAHLPNEDPSTEHVIDSQFIRLSTTEDNSGGVEFTTGVSTIVDGSNTLLQLEISDSTPSTLYWFDTRGTGKGGKISIVTWDRKYFSTPKNYYIEQTSSTIGTLRYGDASIDGIGYPAYVNEEKTESLVFMDVDPSVTDWKATFPWAPGRGDTPFRWIIIHSDVASIPDGAVVLSYPHAGGIYNGNTADDTVSWNLTKGLNGETYPVLATHSFVNALIDYNPRDALAQNIVMTEANPLDGQMAMYNETAEAWQAVTTGIKEIDLEDEALKNDAPLVWSASTSKFEPSGFILPDISSDVPGHGDTLIWDSTKEQVVFGQATGGGISAFDKRLQALSMDSEGLLTANVNMELSSVQFSYEASYTVLLQADGLTAGNAVLRFPEGGSQLYVLSDPSGPTTLRLSETQDGTHGGGVEYSTNVVVNGSGDLEITVDADTPSLFLYDPSAAGLAGAVALTTQASDLKFYQTADSFYYQEDLLQKGQAINAQAFYRAWVVPDGSLSIVFNDRIAQDARWVLVPGDVTAFQVETPLASPHQLYIDQFQGPLDVPAVESYPAGATVTYTAVDTYGTTVTVEIGLDNLKDVVLTGGAVPVEGSTITWSEADQKYVVSDGSVPVLDLAGEHVDGASLVYDAAQGKWVVSSNPVVQVANETLTAAVVEERQSISYPLVATQETPLPVILANYDAGFAGSSLTGGVTLFHPKNGEFFFELKHADGFQVDGRVYTTPVPAPETEYTLEQTAEGLLLPVNKDTPRQLWFSNFIDPSSVSNGMIQIVELAEADLKFYESELIGSFQQQDATSLSFVEGADSQGESVPVYMTIGGAFSLVAADYNAVADAYTEPLGTPAAWIMVEGAVTAGAIPLTNQFMYDNISSVTTLENGHPASPSGVYTAQDGLSVQQSIHLTHLGDVDTLTTPPADASGLVWSETAQKWVPTEGAVPSVLVQEGAVDGAAVVYDIESGAFRLSDSEGVTVDTSGFIEDGAPVVWDETTQAFKASTDPVVDTTLPADVPDGATLQWSEADGTFVVSDQAAVEIDSSGTLTAKVQETVETVQYTISGDETSPIVIDVDNDGLVKDSLGFVTLLHEQEQTVVYQFTSQTALPLRLSKTLVDPVEFTTGVTVHADGDKLLLSVTKRTPRDLYLYNADPEAAAPTNAVHIKVLASPLKFYATPTSFFYRQVDANSAELAQGTTENDGAAFPAWVTLNGSHSIVRFDHDPVVPYVGENIFTGAQEPWFIVPGDVRTFALGSAPPAQDQVIQDKLREITGYNVGVLRPVPVAGQEANLVHNAADSHYVERPMSIFNMSDATRTTQPLSDTGLVWDAALESYVPSAFPLASIDTSGEVADQGGVIWDAQLQRFVVGGVTPQIEGDLMHGQGIVWNQDQNKFVASEYPIPDIQLDAGAEAGSTLIYDPITDALVSSGGPAAIMDGDTLSTVQTAEARSIALSWDVQNVFDVPTDVNGLASTGTNNVTLFYISGTERTFRFTSNFATASLRLSTTQHGTHGGGVEYTTGVQATADGFTLVVKDNVPRTLWLWDTVQPTLPGRSASTSWASTASSTRRPPQR